MSDKPTTNVKEHARHTSKHVDHDSMNQIRNVDFAGHATLAKCGCNWYGWVDNTVLEQWLTTKA